MYISYDDTIVAPATIPGTGAITVLRLSGTKALEIADKVLKCTEGTICDTQGFRIRFCKAYSSSGAELDEVLASVFHSPHSYTGEDSVEISCHASKYIAEQLILAIVNAGARMAEPGEFTRRAFVNGKLDLAQAEAVADVIASQSKAAFNVAYNQMKGGFSKELKQMRDELLHITSLMELELDFSEEEVEFADRKQLKLLVDNELLHIAGLISSFSAGNAIKNGVPVVIVGAANSGKSTLLNDLLGEDRAIVSDVPGTTRDTIEETMNLDGVLFRFIDTAGIRSTTETVEKIGIERTFLKISEASVVLGLLDAGASVDEIRSVTSLIVSKVDFSRQKLFLLLNKIDKFSTTDLKSDHPHFNKNVSTLNEIVSNSDNKIVTLSISAKSMTGISALKSAISDSQKDLLGDSDTTMVTNLRHYEALKNIHTSLSRVRSGLDTRIPTDLIAQDLREALYYLGTIVGEITTDEVLGNVFKNFCIGK